MDEKMIIDAYVKIRTIDNTIPDEVLDFMKDCAIKRIYRIEAEEDHKAVMSLKLQPKVFTSLDEALKELCEVDYPCRYKYGPHVSLTYYYEADSWYVKLLGFRAELGTHNTPLEACQKMYDYLVVMGFLKFKD